MIFKHKRYYYVELLANADFSSEIHALAYIRCYISE